MKSFEPTEEQVAHRRFLQWQYGEDKIQELKAAGKELNLPCLRQELIAKINATGLTQMQHEDVMSLLGTENAQAMQELILQANGSLLCAVLWATGKEALLPE